MISPPARSLSLDRTEDDMKNASRGNTRLQPPRPRITIPRIVAATAPETDRNFSRKEIPEKTVEKSRAKTKFPGDTEANKFPLNLTLSLIQNQRIFAIYRKIRFVFRYQSLYIYVMNRVPDQPLIISASRTKDMVRRSPDLLTDVLLGKAACRWGPHGPFGQVEPERLHSVVLWTKDPRNLLTHQPLRRALMKLRTEHSVLITLQITATGLGGSFVEPGIPYWQNVYSSLKELLAEGWIEPASVIYRFDPFLTVRTPGGNELSNAQIGLFERVCAEFLSLGIPRVTTSRADAVRYPKVAERITKLGLTWIYFEDAFAADFCRQMSDFCRSLRADFSVCCDPLIPGMTDNRGCIDARWLNQVKGNSSPPATEILHNKIGKQRPPCQCTYSRDIGYSTGSATCYSGGFGCLYCYAQGNAQPPSTDQILSEIRQFDQDPAGYLKARDLLPYLLRSSHP